ncbi:zona pellucida sperm-binding protein 3-like isoform X1 [Alosa sapidissima]|uniref:zona pellucida sperm-binding protein 3-like isoform X1 n=1 Tax=Alosa sapidissima TaxID=34773 RepID=UPI001C096B21|nr:zona pellucida sperm-binding protein 3-like isoform X1 [Alosa sapidissima]
MHLLFQTISAIIAFTFTYGVSHISNNKNSVLFENATNLSTSSLVVPQRRKSLAYKLKHLEEFSGKEIEDGSSKSGLRLACGEKNLKITIKRDFFGRGVPFPPSFIRLGDDPEAHGVCRPPQMNLLSSTEMVLSAGLHDCGSKSEVIGDWLIYSNRLVFTPAPLQTFSGSLIQRGLPSVVLIECHYKRRQTVRSEPLTPTWLPMTSTVQAAGLLSFSLKVMGDDWRSVSSSMVYLQGEPVFLEAAVSAPLHPLLRLYVDYCVASLDSDPLSKPRYEFIVNHGCLVDSLMPYSSSQFAPRAGDNSLRFSIQAFQFTQESQQEQVVIKCHLTVLPKQVAPDNLYKACSFHQPSLSWRSADGDDAVCSCCVTGDCLGHKHGTNMKAISSTPTPLPTTEKKTNTAVGPLHFLPRTQ